jgi:hypothetical protein
VSAIAIMALPWTLRIGRMSIASGYLAVLKRRIPHILVLTVLFSAMDAMRAFPVLFDLGWQGVLGVGEVVVQALCDCAVIVAAITAAERTRFAQAHRGIALVATVVLAAPIATAIGAFAVWLTHFIPFDARDRESLYFYILWYSFAIGFLAAAYFTMWERAQRTATRLRAAEIERQGIQQRVVESKLNVMKARVDPDFLFRMMADVQRLYRADVDAAEQRLEDLIDYLRAALPRMRGGVTTLGEEFQLAEAYVRLHEEAFEGRLSCRFDVDEALESTQFPPMALLPLIDDALRRAAATPNPRLAMRVIARREGARLGVSVEDDCERARLASEGEPRLLEHERSFHQFFGAGARMERKAGATSGTRVLLEIEHAAAGAHR